MAPQKSLPELAKEKLASGNASQLGDPISLKAETADSEPTEQDRGARGAMPARKTTGDGKEQQQQSSGKEQGGSGKREGDGKVSLKEAAMRNPSALGDPVSLKAETSDSEPTEEDRGALGTGKGRNTGSKL